MSTQMIQCLAHSAHKSLSIFFDAAVLRCQIKEAQKKLIIQGLMTVK